MSKTLNEHNFDKTLPVSYKGAETSMIAEVECLSM